MEVLLCLKIIVSSMALTMFGGATTMLETPIAQAASYNSTSSSYFDVTPEEASAFYQSQDYKTLKAFMDDFEARNPYVLAEATLKVVFVCKIQ